MAPSFPPMTYGTPGLMLDCVNVLVIVNDQPYGSERPYNALRLAGTLSKRGEPRCACS
jgi:hypothetical protein